MKTLTQRQRLIKLVGRRIGETNYAHYAQENGLPLLPDQQETAQDLKERFDSDLKFTPIVNDKWGDDYVTVNAVLGSYAFGHGYDDYLDSISERSYKQLLGQIWSEAERVKNIHIDAEKAKLRTQERERQAQERERQAQERERMESAKAFRQSQIDQIEEYQREADVDSDTEIFYDSFTGMLTVGEHSVRVTNDEVGQYLAYACKSLDDLKRQYILRMMGK